MASHMPHNGWILIRFMPEDYSILSRQFHGTLQHILVIISLLKCPFPCSCACIPTLMLISLVKLLSLLSYFFLFIYASIHALMLLYLMSYSFLPLMLLPMLLCFYLCNHALIPSLIFLHLPLYSYHYFGIPIPHWYSYFCCHVFLPVTMLLLQIGRASCRERV